VLVAVLAVGCSSDPGHPRTLPNLTATPTPSPTPKVSDLEATARSWFRLLQGPTTLATADAIDDITTPSCKCRRASASIREAVRKEEHYFGRIRLISLRAALDGRNLGEVVVTYDQDAGGLKSADGRVLSSVVAHVGVSSVLRLTRQQGGWRISAIEAISEGKPA